MMLSYSKTTLRNGMRVILAPLANTRAVTVLVLVGTGSKYEQKPLNGISHFLEHMFFKGTKKRPDKKEIAELLDGVGAEFNAFTSNEITGYYVKVASAHINLALDVVADILAHSTFPAAEMNTEKNVVIEEIKMIADTPMRQIYEHWEQLLYGDQPAGWPITGTSETVRAVTRADLLEYVERQYRGESMVVCVAGNFSKEKTVKEIQKFFAEARAGRARDKLPAVETQKRPQVFLATTKTKQTHILVGGRAFPLADERRYPMAVLANILGGGMSSRLFLSVRDDKGLVYYIRTQGESTTDTGYLATAAGIDHVRVPEAIRAIMKEYRAITKKEVGLQELTKAKNSIRGRLLIGLEESDDIASYLASQELLEGEMRDPEEEMKRIERVTAKQVRQVANDIFRYDRMNMAVLGPHRDKKMFINFISDI